MKGKLLIIAIGVFLSFTTQAQENFPLKGKIVADSLDGSAVHIINKTQKTGTVNSSTGTFVVEVRAQDTLVFSSIQYINEERIISKDDLEKGFIEVRLLPDVNELAEINISNVTLTGNINTDISNMEIVKDLPVNLNFGAVKNQTFKADFNDPLAAPDHLAMRQNEISTGAGSVNILGGLGLLADWVGIKERRKMPVYSGSVKPASQQVRDLFSDDFFVSSLGIKKEQIKDFIFYLDDVQLNAELLKKENQLALIEFLFSHSAKYKALQPG